MIIIDLMVVLPFAQLQMIEEKMQKQIDKLLTSDMAGAEEENINSTVRCYIILFGIPSSAWHEVKVFSFL